MAKKKYVPDIRRWAVVFALFACLCASVCAITAKPALASQMVNTASCEYVTRQDVPMPRESASATLTVAGLSMSLTKSAPAEAYAGGNILYTMVAGNPNGAQLTGVTVVDQIPAGTSFVSADSGGLLSGGTVTWNVGTLAPGESRTLLLTVEVDTSIINGIIITNEAMARSNESPPWFADAQTRALVRTPGSVIFCDTSGSKSYEYNIGDQVCMQVTDPDQNLDPQVQETVTVTVRHYSKMPDGTRVVDDMVTVTLTETGPDTGVFRGCVQSDAGPPDLTDNIISLDPDSYLSVTYIDPLDATPSVDDTALIDPSGTVFDSITGDPVSGAVVTLIDNNTGQPASLPQPPEVPKPQENPVTTGADGKFQFEFVPSGRYRLAVVPGGSHSYPSKVPTSELPSQYNVIAGSKGEVFDVDLSLGPLTIDVPVDPPAGPLQVQKTADRSTASIGDVVGYTVRVKNDGMMDVDDMVVNDVMPHGVVYVKGSTLVGGRPAPDPEVHGTTLIWPIGPVHAGRTVELRYSAVVGPDSARGDGRNVAFAKGTSVLSEVTSNRAVFRLDITEGIFTTKAVVVGRVFQDKDADGAQGHGEAGVPDVVLYLEDGTRVITGKDGKYSIYGVRPGIHMLKVDMVSLPEGARLVPASNRSMGDGGSLFVDIPPSGGLHKANFAVILPEGVKPEAKPKEEAAREAPNTDTPIEERIKDYTPSLEILSPHDGDVVTRGAVKVVVKAPALYEVLLSVNGQQVGKDRVGKTVVDDDTNVAAYEYIGVKVSDTGSTVIRAQSKDPFGNIRETSEVTVTAPAKPAKVLARPDKDEAPADGVSRVHVTVSAVDVEGRPARPSTFVTVVATRGEVVQKDMDPVKEGVQIPYFEKGAEFEILAPRETGEAEVTVSCDEINESFKVFFSPPRRPMIIAGVGEVVAGYGTARGKHELVGLSWFDKGLYAGGKGAFFMKGMLFDDVFLTAAYDSDKKKSDVGIFREKDNNVESEARYPIQGDESKQGFEAMSRDQLYAKVEKGRSSVMYGDYQTNLTDTRLAAFTRTFTGVKSEIEAGPLRLRAFASHTDHNLVIDEFLARGIAGYYFLSRSPVVDGSERVVIETRDSRQTERVINRVVKNRWMDYTIDYNNGTVLFKEPVPSHDDELNPIYVIVTYEEAGSRRHYVYGGRLAVLPVKWAEAGFTGVVEEMDAFDNRLLGTDVKLKLPLNLALRMEWAQTRTLFEESGSFDPRTGSAWMARIEGAPLDRLRVLGYYGNTTRFFNNPSAVDVMRGKERYGFEYSCLPLRWLTFSGKFFNEKDTLNDMRHLRMDAGLQAAFKDTKLGFEVLYEQSNQKFIPATNPDTRFPFDVSEQTPRKVTALKLHAETKLWKGLTASIEHTQDIIHNRDNVTQAGLAYQLTETTRLYVREQYLTVEDRSLLRTVVGAESSITQDTTAYSEYRLVGVSGGSHMQQVIGLRNKFTLTKDVTGNVAVEDLKTLTGDTMKNEPDAFAASAGLEYLASERLKMSARGEYRDSKHDSSILGEMGLAYKLGSDLSLLLKERYFDGSQSGSGKRVTNTTMLGLAYRPVWTDMFNALAKFEYKHDKAPANSSRTLSDFMIVSVEGVCQPYKRLQAIGKYAAKLTISGNMDSYTDLYSLRLLYDISDRFDMGLTGRTLTNHLTGTRLIGGAAEVGYKVMKNVWFSAGYSFDRFDSDLTQDDYWGQGPFVRLRVKADENLTRRAP